MQNTDAVYSKDVLRKLRSLTLEKNSSFRDIHNEICGEKWEKLEIGLSDRAIESSASGEPVIIDAIPENRKDSKGVVTIITQRFEQHCKEKDH